MLEILVECNCRAEISRSYPDVFFNFMLLFFFDLYSSQFDRVEYLYITTLFEFNDQDILSDSENKQIPLESTYIFENGEIFCDDPRVEIVFVIDGRVGDQRAIETN